MNLVDVDLVFFIIIRSSHYYLIVFNLNNPTIEIKDNIKDNHAIEVKYGFVRQIVLTSFCNFLRDVKHPKLEEIRLLEKNVKRLQMPSRTKKNTDCGIFVMHHMKTYYGSEEDWVCDITRETNKKNTQKKMITKLRYEYPSTILLHELNVLKDQAFAEIEEWSKVSAIDTKKFTEKRVKVILGRQ